MTDERLVVANDMVVSLDYTLRLDDDEVVDSSEGNDPLEYLQGHGQIIPGLEQALNGMAVDEEKQVEVAPAEGYGEEDPDGFQLVEKSIFPEDMRLEIGMALRMRDSEGQPMVAHVAELRPDGVLLDFNHPLAGETLFFQVKIAGLRKATEEELAHGHVHGDHDHH